MCRLNLEGDTKHRLSRGCASSSSANFTGTFCFSGLSTQTLTSPGCAQHGSWLLWIRRILPGTRHTPSTRSQRGTEAPQSSRVGLGRAARRTQPPGGVAVTAPNSHSPMAQRRDKGQQCPREGRVCLRLAVVQRAALPQQPHARGKSHGGVENLRTQQNTGLVTSILF